MYSSDSKIENQKKMLEVRSQKASYGIGDFLNHSFASGDDKEALFDYFIDLRAKLKGLTNSEADTKVKTLALGKTSYNLLLRLKIIQKKISRGKINIKKYIETQLGKDANRVYEATAAYRATKKGVPKDANLTVLIEIGAALKSKNEHKRLEIQKWVKNGQTPSNQSLSKISVKELRQAMRDIKDNSSTDFDRSCIKLLKATQQYRFDLKKIINVMKIDKVRKKDDVYKLKSEFESLVIMIGEFYNEVVPTTKLH